MSVSLVANVTYNLKMTLLHVYQILQNVLHNVTCHAIICQFKTKLTFSSNIFPPYYFMYNSIIHLEK